VKCHEYFAFEKVIYADMFLYKNHGKANLIREEIELTKALIKSLSEELKNY
jgi:hypothetical protein